MRMRGMRKSDDRFSEIARARAWLCESRERARRTLYRLRLISICTRRGKWRLRVAPRSLNRPSSEGYGSAKREQRNFIRGRGNVLE